MRGEIEVWFEVILCDKKRIGSLAGSFDNIMRKIWLYIVGLAFILMILKTARDKMHQRSSKQVEYSYTDDPSPAQYAALPNNNVKQENNKRNNLQMAPGEVTSPLRPVATGSKAELLPSSPISEFPTKKPTGSPRQVNSTEMNSTHIKNRLMEPINSSDYVKNIYFGIKTTSKYHGTRLPVLMVTWFQAVKDKVQLSL